MPVRIVREDRPSEADINTFDFQVGPSFYQRQGYKVFGVLRDHPPGGTHFFLWKALSRSRDD